jgi:hypothetical protein
MFQTRNPTSESSFSRATLAEHFEQQLKLHRHGSPLAHEVLKFLEVDDVEVDMQQLRAPAYELPNLHRGLRRMHGWRLEATGGDTYMYRTLWAPTYQRVQVRPGKFVSFMSEGSLYYRLPCGGRRVVLFDLDSDPPEVALTVIGPRRDRAQMRRELAALVRYGKRHHYLRGQALRADGTLLKRGQRVVWDDVVLEPALRRAVEENTFGILRRRAEYRRNGVPQKRGVLLYGPPGTGKTMVGKALADARAGTFIWATAADITSSCHLRALFTMARKLRPAIVFLEDLDLFASGRGGQSDLTLGELLPQMDGLESNDGIIVVATTNDLAAIEPALAERPSRFDVVLEVGLPGFEARRAILLKQLARQAPADDLLDAAARETEGLTGAQLREVAFLAVQQAILRNALDERGLAAIDGHDLVTAAEQVSGRRKRMAIGFGMTHCR